MTVTVIPLYAGLAGLLLLVLSFRVTSLRRSAGVGIGDGDNPALARAIRSQANFIEYTPTALLLILLLELTGSSHALLHILGIALIVARLAHGYGLSTNSGVSPGRFVGATVTWLVILVAAVLCLAAHFSVKI
jgi:uncharacterized membrane protein YecN with MAPEG domain